MSDPASRRGCGQSPLESVMFETAGRASGACGSRLPAFFVIGPPRTGTSWLRAILKEHVLLPSPAKETRFFDIHFHRGIGWYLAHYPNLQSALVVGEIAPTYFASITACQGVARAIPNAKVVCIFRHPVHRVVSLYRLKRAYGMIPWEFEEAITRDPELLESSKYATYLKLWQAALGTKQVLPTMYEDLEHCPQSYVDALSDFIGLARFTLAPSVVRDVNSSMMLTHPRSYYRTRTASLVAERLKARRLDFIVAGVKNSPLVKLFLGGGAAFAELSHEVLRRLYDLLRPEVEELEAILNRDFSAWKSLDARLAQNQANTPNVPPRVWTEGELPV
jgi:sulfotransferase family protein